MKYVPRRGESVSGVDETEKRVEEAPATAASSAARCKSLDSTSSVACGRASVRVRATREPAAQPSQSASPLAPPSNSPAHWCSGAAAPAAEAVPSASADGTNATARGVRCEDADDGAHERDTRVRPADERAPTALQRPTGPVPPSAPSPSVGTRSTAKRA